VDSWKEAMDRAIALCGSQKALAEKLAVSAQRVTDAKKGRQPLPKGQIEALASLIEADPAQLWELQEVANLPRRNPFLQVAGAMLSAFVCVVLTVGQNDAKADAYRENSVSGRNAEYTLSYL